MIHAITSPSQWEPPRCSIPSQQFPEQESTQPILSPAPLQQRLAGFDSIVVLPKPGLTRVFRYIQMTVLKILVLVVCDEERGAALHYCWLSECLVLDQLQCFPRNGHED